MPRKPSFFAFVLSLALHAVVLAWAAGWVFKPADAPPPPKAQTTVVYLNLPKPPDLPQREPVEPKPITAPAPKPAPVLPQVTTTPTAPATRSDAPRATMAAPPPPTAEEWAFAARYTNKTARATATAGASKCAA